VVIIADRPLRLDERLRVTLRLRPGTSVRAPACVRHLQSGVHGGRIEYRVLLVFGELAPVPKAELREWLEAGRSRQPQH
jgi:hypothetical protein